MFSDTFNQIATLAGINTDDLVTRMGLIDERYKDSDKGDINIAADWLKTISEEISVKEVAFLLMAALRPEASLKDYQVDETMEQFLEMLKEQGFIELPDGSWVSPAYLESMKKDEEKKPEVKPIKALPEPKPIGYTPALEATRNALGYDHSQMTLLNAIGLDEGLLNTKMQIVLSNMPEGISASRSIETFEREFTRKELAYMYTFKAKRYDELLESSKKEILELENKINTITKPKRKTKTIKKDNENIQ